MTHDFNRFPELTNNQMQLYYFESPHKQIMNDFWGRVIEVHDGDTASIKWSERTRPVRVRFANIAAKELSEGGQDSRDWMTNRILGKYVMIAVDPDNRVGKWGRLIGRVFEAGSDVGLESIMFGFAEAFI